MPLLEILGGGCFVGIGSFCAIGKFKRHLFLKLPNGFIPWAISGGRMPPYFSDEWYQKEHFSNFVKDGDVVLSTGAKSGTAWLQWTTYLIGRDGNPVPMTDLLEVIGSGEFVAYPTESITDRASFEREKRDRYENMHGKDPFRLWFSHMAPDGSAERWGLEVKEHPNVKYMCIMRNGQEVVRSFFSFFQEHDDDFRKLWGGFPPVFKKKEEALKFVVKDQPHFYFGYAKAWWGLRNEANVLILHYSELMHSRRETIKKIAGFLNVEVTTEGMERIHELTSFEWMKKNESLYKVGLLGEDRQLNALQVGARIRQGKCDAGGSNFFTAEMRETWDAAVEREFHDYPELKHWLENGGPIPKV